jgi:hypothetical protein
MRMERWLVGYMEECVEGWMDVGWVYEWVGGGMDGW